MLRVWKGDAPPTAHVCASHKGGHVTREAVEKCYRDTLGLRDRHSPHGWRSALSSVAHEAGHPHDAIEAQLDHANPHGKVAGAYDRGNRLAARRALVEWWAACLWGAAPGAATDNVLQFPVRAA
jgi:integrase